MSGAKHLFRQASSEVMEFNQKRRGTSRGIFIFNYEGYKHGRSPGSHQGTPEPGTYLKVTQERFQCVPTIQTLHEKSILSASIPLDTFLAWLRERQIALGVSEHRITSAENSLGSIRNSGKVKRRKVIQTELCGVAMVQGG